MPDRAMAAQTALLRRRFRPAWSGLEDMVIDGYVRDFVRGRYRSAAEAARVCQRQLEKLHARHPEKPWGTFPRTLLATEQHIAQRRLASGDSWTCVNFLPREEAVLNHYVGALMRGRYRRIQPAAIDCWRQLRRQADAIRLKEFGLTGTPAPRSLKAVATQLEKRTIALGRALISRPWSAPEVRVVDKWVRRYVRALERRAGPSQTEALESMRAELEGRGYPERPDDGYRGFFEKRLRGTAVGQSRPGRGWTPGEKEIARRWARRVLAARRAGSEFFITTAARGLRTELARNGHRRTGRACEGMVDELVRVIPGTADDY